MILFDEGGKRANYNDGWNLVVFAAVMVAGMIIIGVLKWVGVLG